MNATAFAEPAAATTAVEGWTLHRADEVESILCAAATLPTWQAVRARVETAARGRGRHSWVSNDGGLWLAAAVPCSAAAAPESTIALAVGSSLIESLQTEGAHGLWLRWPNDLMVGRQKIGAVFIERIRDDAVVVAVALNVFNHPEAVEPGLTGKVARLADFIHPATNLWSLETVVLRALRRAQRAFSPIGFTPVNHALNVHWSCPSHVEVSLTSTATRVAGFFQGIDGEGRMRLVSQHGESKVYSVSEVAELRELD